jgi:hypothetical protein
MLAKESSSIPIRNRLFASANRSASLGQSAIWSPSTIKLYFSITATRS